MLSPSLLAASLSYFFNTLIYVLSPLRMEKSCLSAVFFLLFRMAPREASRKWPFRGITIAMFQEPCSWGDLSIDNFRATIHVTSPLSFSAHGNKARIVRQIPQTMILILRKYLNIFASWLIEMQCKAQFCFVSVGSRSGSSLVNYRLRIRASGVGVSSLWVCFCSLQFSKIPFPFP